MCKLISSVFLLAFSSTVLAQDAPVARAQPTPQADGSLPVGTDVPLVGSLATELVPAPASPAPPVRPPVISIMPGEQTGAMHPANILPVTGPIAYALDGAQLRASPSNKGRVLARLRNGLKVERYATLQVGENLWWQTEIEGLGTGWISERDLNGAP